MVNSLTALVSPLLDPAASKGYSLESANPPCLNPPYSGKVSATRPNPDFLSLEASVDDELVELLFEEDCRPCCWNELNPLAKVKAA